MLYLANVKVEVEAKDTVPESVPESEIEPLDIEQVKRLLNSAKVTQPEPRAL